MTAPASFWYLQNLAIDAISNVVDYIVFMTYDLHGQWDYGAAFSDPGCPDGNCLRSDVNLTETMNALSMITKAGVPSNKVVVGVTSYGRSFQMTTPGCYTEMCTYTGPESGAIPGSCTQTAGYLGGGEIDSIISQNTSEIFQYVDDSFSNILVYESDQWVSYMDDNNKATRTQLYRALNLGGTSDWAIDLQSNGTTDYLDPGSGDDGDGSGLVYVDPSIWTDPTPVVNCIPPCSFVMPPLTLPTNTTIFIPPTSVFVTVSTPTSITTTWGSTTTVLAAYSPMFFGTVVDIPPCKLLWH
jgi:chitinase